MSNTKNADSTVFNQAMSKIVEAVAESIKKYIKKAPYTWEFNAKVLSYEGNGAYKVKNLDTEYKAISAYQFDIGTRVRVIVPNNQFKDIYLMPYKKCKGFINN